MGKRGISPLIATVVLIAFAVSLGAVVMNLGSGLVGNSQLSDQKECTGMSLLFHDLNGPQVSFGGQGGEGFVEFVVDHSGTEPIAEARLRVSGERNGRTEVCITDLDDSAVEPGYSLSKRVPYNYDTCGEPRQVEVMPLARRDGKRLPCLASAAKHTLR